MCLQKLENDEYLYHSHCCKELFNSTQPPSLLIDMKEIENFALQNLNKRFVVTGVQKKLSIGVMSEYKNGIPKLTIVGGLSGQYILKPESIDPN